MAYTQVWDATSNKVSDTTVQRDEDQAFIPFDEANIDYQAYLAWLDEGNTPTPYTPPSSGAVADSAQSLEFANVKSLAAQGRTDEAVVALTSIVEAQS